MPERAQANAVVPPLPGQLPIAAEEGALAPPFEVHDLANKPISLTALRGSPVILNFWATYCGPCIVEMPLLQSVYAAHRAEGLHVIGVDANEPLADVMAWRNRFDLSYDLVFDGGMLSSLYRVRGLPSTFFIGRDGVITKITFGAVSAEELQAEVANLLH